METSDDASLTDEFWREARALQRSLETLRELSDKNRRSLTRVEELVRELAILPSPE